VLKHRARMRDAFAQNSSGSRPRRILGSTEIAYSFALSKPSMRAFVGGIASRRNLDSRTCRRAR
jgi:hypothetical protein